MQTWEEEKDLVRYPPTNYNMDTALEVEYLADSIKHLHQVFAADVHGNSCILHTSPKILGLSSVGKQVLKSISGSPAKVKSSSPTKAPRRSALDDIVGLLSRHVASTTTDLVIKNILGHDYSQQPFETTCKTIAIQLCHNEDSTDFVFMYPKHTHYSTLAVDEEAPQSERILSLKEVRVQALTVNRSKYNFSRGQCP